LSNAKVGAMALVLTIGMVACGTASNEAPKADSTAVVTDSTAVAPVADTTATK
jgi:hypothetical protein